MPQVPIINRKTGEKGAVDPEELGAAQQQGWEQDDSPEGQEWAAREGWNDASLEQKTQTTIARGIKSLAGNLIAPVQIATAAIDKGAGVLGLDTGLTRALNEQVNPEQFVEDLDYLAGKDEGRNAEMRRRLEAGMPLVPKLGAEVAGFLGAGGVTSLAAKGLSAGAARLGLEAMAPGSASLGHAAGHAVEHALGGRAGKLAGSAVTNAIEGAPLQVEVDSNDAWVKGEDVPFTAEATLISAGLGAAVSAALGAGITGAGMGLKEAKDALAKRALGALSKPAELERMSASAIEAMTEDMAGQKPPEGFGKMVRGFLDSLRGKVEGAQALRTGAPEEAIKRVGAFRATPEAVEAQEMFLNRPQILDKAADDMTGALADLHRAAEPILEITRNSDLKRAAVAPLVDTAPEQVMAVGKSKIDDLTAALAKVDEVTPRGVPIMGKGKATQDLRFTIQDAIDKLASAKAPEDVAIALDQFKRGMDRVKVNAERTRVAARTGMDLAQSEARIQYARTLADDARNLLMDEAVFGKFGAAQREVNSLWTRMLSTNDRVVSDMTRRVNVSGGPNYGMPTYEFEKAKVGAYLEGLGTAKSASLEEKLLDNVASRRDLAKAIVANYDLTAAHAADLKAVVEASESLLELNAKMDQRVKSSNLLNMIAKAEQDSAHGLGSIALGAAVGTVVGGVMGGPVGAVAGALATAADYATSRPFSMIRHAAAIRSMVQRVDGRISKAVSKAISGGAAGRAATLEGRLERGAAHGAAHGVEAEEASLARRYVAEGGKEAGKHPVLHGLRGHEEGGHEPSYAHAGAIAAVAAQHAEKRREEKRYETVATHVMTLSADPHARAKAAEAITAKVPFQNVSASAAATFDNGIAFLASKVPGSILANSPMRPQTKAHVSDVERAKFMRYWEAVDNPLTVLDRISSGRLTPEHVAAIRAVYPAFYAKVQLEVFKQLTELGPQHRIPYQRRLNLAKVFGDPSAAEPTLDRGFQDRIAQMTQAAVQQEQQKRQQQRQQMQNTMGKAAQGPLDQMRL